MGDLLGDLKRALETGDAELWESLHSEDFEQTELWHKTDPPSNPSKRTRDEMVATIRRATGNSVQFRVENMVGDDKRLAYTATCIMPSGRTVIANNIAEIKDGLIVRELVIEAGEPDA
jgi:hypothetical protein